MEVRIYGAENCSKCNYLKEKAEEIVEDRNLDAEVVKVNDPAELAKKGIMSTPALEIGDEVMVKGEVPPENRLEEILAENT